MVDLGERLKATKWSYPQGVVPRVGSVLLPCVLRVLAAATYTQGQAAHPASSAACAVFPPAQNPARLQLPRSHPTLGCSALLGLAGPWGHVLYLQHIC